MNPTEARAALSADASKAYKDIQRIYARLFITQNIPACDAWAFMGNPRKDNMQILFSNFRKRNDSHLTSFRYKKKKKKNLYVNRLQAEGFCLRVQKGALPNTTRTGGYNRPLLKRTLFSAKRAGQEASPHRRSSSRSGNHPPVSG